jgi:uncharacterized cupin superfamily protein
VTDEAAFIDGPDGTRRPQGEGWFVTNLADATWVRDERAGVFCTFEADDAHFADFGINVHVVEPGQANGLYHAESVQEAFLVLHGECTLLVEGQERRLVSGDFFHCPAGVWHVIVGGGAGPCAILMVGRREPGKTIQYAPNEVAEKYGASAKEETDQPRVAYADWASTDTPTRGPWPFQ